jgi:deoxycytidylate deaminase
MSNVIPYPRIPEEKKFSSGVKHSRYLNILSKIAADVITPAVNNARLAACVVHKNNIVAFGVNEMKSHPFQAKYGKNKDSVYLHAETSAIKNALKYISLEQLKSSTLYICRVKFSDSSKTKMIFGISKPCSGCFRCINSFDIGKVIYTLDGEDFAHL